MAMKKLTTFVSGMGAPTNVTVPSIMQLENLKGFSYRLNDFALFSGALPQQTKSLKGPNPVAFGMVWTTANPSARILPTVTI